MADMVVDALIPNVCVLKELRLTHLQCAVGFLRPLVENLPYWRPLDSNPSLSMYDDHRAFTKSLGIGIPTGAAPLSLHEQ